MYNINEIGRNFFNKWYVATIQCKNLQNDKLLFVHWSYAEMRRL